MLTWHTYPDHLKGMMQEMMASEDFADVTLVCDDMKTIKAHRNILSACSPVFKNILLMESQTNHPVIYLRGIQYPEIESILQFIYLGEAKIYEERMDEIILVSKNLEIKELRKAAEVNETQPDPSDETAEDIDENIANDTFDLVDNITTQKDAKDVEYNNFKEENVAGKQLDLTKHIQSKHQITTKSKHEAKVSGILVISVTIKLDTRVI